MIKVSRGRFKLVSYRGGGYHPRHYAVFVHPIIIISTGNILIWSPVGEEPCPIEILLLYLIQAGKFATTPAPAPYLVERSLAGGNLEHRFSIVGKRGLSSNALQ